MDTLHVPKDINPQATGTDEARERVSRVRP